MSNNLTVEILQVSGLTIAAQYVGLPVGKIRPKADIMRSFGNLDRGSVSRLSRLISQGDEHAKIMRQVTAHMEITAPRYWWQQFACYHAGVEMYSASTMHTLMRGVSSEDFVYGVQEDCQDMVDYFINESPNLGYAKANLPEGFLQTRLVMVSYQTLRRIFLQRKSHRLPEWGEFILAMYELPHCDDLIFVEPKNPWRDLWDGVIDTDCWDSEGRCRFCRMHSSVNHKAECLFDRADTMMADEIWRETK